MTLPVASQPPSSLTRQSIPRPRPSSKALDSLSCITHPITGQLLAPGSKVWSYFVDHPKFGRNYAGPRGRFPQEFQKPRPKLVSAQVPVKVAEADVKMENRKNPEMKEKKKDENKIKEKGQKNDTTKVPVKAPDIKKSIPTAIKRPRGRPANNHQIRVLTSATVTPAMKPTTRKSQSQANIDSRYTELVQRNTTLRLKGKVNESHMIQAAINIGIILGWNKIDVLDVIEKLEKVVHTERGNRQYSSKIMEVIGEIERFRTNEWSDWKDLRRLRDNFKGRFYDGIGGIEAEKTGTRLRAPGFLMSLQATINVAFLRGLDLAAEDGEGFDEGVFDGKVVLFFRVPNKACVEEKDYLMQMSRLGTAKSVGRKVAACPGIERSIKEDERRNVLEKVRGQVEGGSEIVQLATMLFGKSTTAEGIGEGKSVTCFAMEHLDDEGVLVLDYVYRKKVGFPVLVGDSLDNDEEEEEEEDMEELSRMTLLEMQVDPGRGRSEGTIPVDSQKPTLIVKLRYRRRGI